MEAFYTSLLKVVIKRNQAFGHTMKWHHRHGKTVKI